jgi:hypothetical protein
MFELIDTIPPTYNHNLTWESLTFPEGYEKPPKEAFEKRYQELIDGFPMQQVRETRNRLLYESDWTDQHDNEDWVAYRQALRDLPANTEDPTHPEWPEPPQVKIVPGENTRTQLETELTETKSALETTRADLEEKTYQLVSVEARLQALEQKILAAN